MSDAEKETPMLSQEAKAFRRIHSYLFKIETAYHACLAATNLSDQAKSGFEAALDELQWALEDLEASAKQAGSESHDA